MKFYSTMLSADILPNIVTYTTLLRGYADCGDLDGTMALLGIMKQNDVMVNDRTLNTVLRGFVHIGEVEKIFELFCCISSDRVDEETVFAVFHCVVPNASSYEMMISALCQALRIDDALTVLEFMVSQPQKSVGVSAGGHTVGIDQNPRVYLALATAALFIKDISRCELWIGLCDKYLKFNDNASLRAAMQMKFDANLDLHEENIDARSVELFLKHRNKETELELESLRTYLTYVKSYGFTNDAVIGLSNFYYFGYSDNTRASRQRKRLRAVSFSEMNTQNLRNKLGLSYLADKKIVAQISSKFDTVYSGSFIDRILELHSSTQTVSGFS